MTLAKTPTTPKSRKRKAIRKPENIHRLPSITVHPVSEVTGLDGDPYLQSVTLTNRRTGEVRSWPIANLFLMIGADPNTEWLQDCLALDERGFVLTGLSTCERVSASPVTTSSAGVFAVGDVRSGSVKRVESGVGGDRSSCRRSINTWRPRRSSDETIV